MNWFLFALITMLAWGTADLFYKKGADEKDKYSHLKTVIAVGVVMGLYSIVTWIINDVDYDLINILTYLPVSLMYIVSMAVGYFGLRYLELSISSPIQNTSGAIVCILCVVFLGQSIDLPVIIAIVLICLALFALGVFEKRDADLLKQKGDKKYRIGFVAFFMPIIYCVVDALGTFLDAFYLDSVITTPLVGATPDNIEDIGMISYGLTFFIAAIICFVYVKFIKKQHYGVKDIKPSRIFAAGFETLGQVTYMYALSSEAVVAAPMIAAYSIVSMVLSRIFLKEKLNWIQYFLIGCVMLGIIVLGVYDI